MGTIQDVSELIKVATSALSLLMKSIRDAYKHGLEIRDLADIRKAEKSVQTLLIAIERVQFLNDAAVVATIERLIRADNQTAESRLEIWHSFLDDVGETLEAITTARYYIRRDDEIHSDSEISKVFRELYGITSIRGGLLRQLYSEHNIPESKQLREFVSEYRALINKMDALCDELRTLYRSLAERRRVVMDSFSK